MGITPGATTVITEANNTEAKANVSAAFAAAI
jgi:hypothetical protein